MQTFLPYADFKQSARCLDYKRLGKQRLEARTILNILEGHGKIGKNGKVAWQNHPATRMWEGYENALKLYYNVILMEWVSRGYKNNMKIAEIEGKVFYPPWFGDERFHSSHRSNLLRKSEYYKQFDWKESPDEPYFWPGREEEDYGQT